MVLRRPRHPDDRRSCGGHLSNQSVGRAAVHRPTQRLTRRNLIYAAYIYAEAVDIADKPFESVCYLPLCHVAERCYSEVMQLVLGGTVSFAESIDTVAINIREIAPTFFVGVPRIYEKLQQHFLFKLGESGRLPHDLSRACLAFDRKRSD